MYRPVVFVLAGLVTVAWSTPLSTCSSDRISRSSRLRRDFSLGPAASAKTNPRRHLKSSRTLPRCCTACTPRRRRHHVPVLRPRQVSCPAPALADCVRQIDQLKRCEIIPEASVKELCLKAKEILMDEGNIQYVDSPVTVSQCWRSS